MIKNLGHAIEAGEDHGMEVSEGGTHSYCGICGMKRRVFLLTDYRRIGAPFEWMRPFKFVGDCCRSRQQRPIDHIEERRAKRHGTKLPPDRRAVPEYMIVRALGDSAKARELRKAVKAKKETSGG